MTNTSGMSVADWSPRTCPRSARPPGAKPLNPSSRYTRIHCCTVDKEGHLLLSRHPRLRHPLFQTRPQQRIPLQRTLLLPRR
ncbi:hypothetical protein [Dictyobacter formicarum]|uniref:hypothetical protein n=1 Tax=Dictyobacter formicarum TaxID=2778368 RepID=UPI001F1E3812|nr:hypothetical protein [Dictyobacter formicarum]